MADVKRYRVVDDETGDTVNAILWDGVQEYDPGPGVTLELILDDDEPIHIKSDITTVPPTATADAKVDALMGIIGSSKSIEDMKARIAADEVLSPAVEPATE